jgi:hypothetical protein
MDKFETRSVDNDQLVNHKKRTPKNNNICQYHEDYLKIVFSCTSEYLYIHYIFTYY